MGEGCRIQRKSFGRFLPENGRKKRRAAKFISIWYPPPFGDARVTVPPEKMPYRIAASNPLREPPPEEPGRKGRIKRI
jgi:hypothetical protein